MRARRLLLAGLAAVTVAAVFYAELRRARTATAPVPTVAAGAGDATPVAAASSGGGVPNCAFTWAYRNLPETSTHLMEEIASQGEAATVRAEAFGEECIHDDGKIGFLTLETDFYFVIPVVELADRPTLAAWIVEGMSAVLALPEELVPGPRPGFVEFRFQAADDEFLVARLPIEDIRSEGSRLDGEQLLERYSQGGSQ